MSLQEYNSFDNFLCDSIEKQNKSKEDQNENQISTNKVR